MSRTIILAVDRPDAVAADLDLDPSTLPLAVYVTPRSRDAARGYTGAVLVVTPRMMLDPRLPDLLGEVRPCFLTSAAPVRQ